MNGTPIYLSDEDIQRFKQFMEHYDAINELLTANVFDIKNGSATMDFNQEGDLMDIKVNVIAYKRKK